MADLIVDNNVADLKKLYLDLLDVAQAEPGKPAPTDPSFTPEIGVDFRLRSVLEEFERRILVKALKLENGKLS